jgi:hypothetical protein
LMSVSVLIDLMEFFGRGEELEVRAAEGKSTNDGLLGSLLLSQQLDERRYADAERLAHRAADEANRTLLFELVRRLEREGVRDRAEQIALTYSGSTKLMLLSAIISTRSALGDIKGAVQLASHVDGLEQRILLLLLVFELMRKGKLDEATQIVAGASPETRDFLSLLSASYALDLREQAGVEQIAHRFAQSTNNPVIISVIKNLARRRNDADA